MRIDLASDPRVFEVRTGTATEEGGTEAETEDTICWRCRLSFGAKSRILGEATEFFENEEGRPDARPRYEVLLPLVLREVVVGWSGVLNGDGEAVEFSPEVAERHVPFGAIMELASTLWRRVISGN